MRKQELVHLHGLLVVVRRHVDEQDEIQASRHAFDAYDEYGVRPTAIAERKEAHHAAVDHLLEGLQTTLTAHQPMESTTSKSSDGVGASTR